MNRRFILILVISIGFHLALLAVRFQRAGSFEVSSQSHVGLVASDQARFAPAEAQSNHISTTLNNPSPRQPLRSVAGLRPENAAVALSSSDLSPEGESAVVESVESVARRSPVVAVTVETAEISDIPSETTDVEPLTGVGQDWITPRVQLEVTATPTVTRVQAMPRYADNPRPHYPEVARRKGWFGEVRLLVQVDASGSVERLSVQRSSGYAALDRAARRAVRLWRFVPASEAGRRVISQVVIPIDFRLPASGVSSSRSGNKPLSKLTVSRQ